MKIAYKYNAFVKKVLDGDTCEAIIDQGFGNTKKIKVRFVGIDTPESRTKDLEEKEMGLVVKQYTKDMIEGKDVAIDSVKLGKFAGRCLGRIYIDDLCINDEILRHRMAVEYWGGSRVAKTKGG